MADEHVEHDASIELAETFADIARALLAEPDLEATLNKISGTAVETVAGCEHAGISLIQQRKISTQGASDDVPSQVDAIQYETGQGPCLDAIRRHEIFVVDDLAHDDRWPDFAARAASETGVRSMLCFRLFDSEQTMGALNLYSHDPSAFDARACSIGAVFAAHAAVAMSTSRHVESLEAALRSRATIEQAKGIVMASARCDASEAFAILRQQSQHLNEKLRDVAAGIVAQQDQSN